MPTPNPFPAAQPHLTTSAGSLVPARETCLREQAWLKNSLMSGETVFTLLKRLGTTWQLLQPSTRHPLDTLCSWVPHPPGYPWYPPGYHTPLTPSQGLLVGVHIFGEIQVDEAGVGSVDQGSKELPEWGCEPCAGGPRGAAAPHIARGWRGTEGRAHCQDPLHPCVVLTASKGQSVPARLRWESEWQWRRRLCRFCEQRGLSSFAPGSHPAPWNPSSSLSPPFC